MKRIWLGHLAASPQDGTVAVEAWTRRAARQKTAEWFGVEVAEVEAWRARASDFEAIQEMAANFRALRDKADREAGELRAQLDELRGGGR